MSVEPVSATPPLLVIDQPHRRRRPRLSRLIAYGLILAGLAVASDVAATLLWQDPVTAAVALIKRADLNRRYIHRLPLTPADTAELASISNTDAKLAFLAARERAIVPSGAALGTLQAPAIGLSQSVVQGTDSGDLELGPGHYSQTDLPGQGGTFAVAGHRTTYLAPFRNLNALKPGDPIVVTMPYGTFTYAVQSVRVIPPNAWWITRNVGHEQLVLSTCNPLYSAAQRLAVFATLTSVAPASDALT